MPDLPEKSGNAAREKVRLNMLEFEKPIIELERHIQTQKEKGDDQSGSQVAELERQLVSLREKIYSGLTRWQRIQLARHPQRPYALDLIERMSRDWVELFGDRGFADDRALVGGFAKIKDRPVLILGQQKGRDTKQKLMRNFAMMHPEGYRKALRLMRLAGKFGRPIVVLIDTPGAFPGIGAEERGQAEAIARNLREMARLPVPIICVIIGEGASGGALGIGIGDRIFMLENAWYTVISPEGCAAILWRDSSRAPEAAEALKPSAQDLLGQGIIDGTIPEPSGGAHRDWDLTAELIAKQVDETFSKLEKLKPRDLIRNRMLKYRVMGEFTESGT
jgi:acetyl-CoA carboxylase carboxyl transferase subunit alpha